MTDDELDRLAQALHDAYENAARDVGWETQKQSRRPWHEVPEANKETMRRAIAEVLPLFVSVASDTGNRTTGGSTITMEWSQGEGAKPEPPSRLEPPEIEGDGVPDSDT